MGGDFLKKWRAQWLNVYRCLMSKNILNAIWNKAQRDATKTEHQPMYIDKNDLLNATMSQRHNDYYGFVKTGFENGGCVRYQFSAFWRHLVDVGAIFDPSDFEGGPKIDSFFFKYKKMRKRRSKKRLWRNMICWTIFDAKMRGLTW